MKKQQTVLYVILGLIGTACLIYLVLNSNSPKYKWHESYRADSDQPYGTLYLRQLLSKYHPGKKFTYNTRKPLSDILRDSLTTRTSLVWVGNAVYLGADWEHVVAFLNRGNDVFAATSTPPRELLKQLWPDTCIEKLRYASNFKSTDTLNFYSDKLKTPEGFRLTAMFNGEPAPTGWSHITLGGKCGGPELTPLGHNASGEPDFMWIRYGKGNLYLHSDPIAFTNYFLSKLEHRPYVEGVFSYLNDGDIIWDEYSKLSLRGEGQKSDGPLFFILKQKALKYAWWTFLAAVLLYIFFAARRRQRAIPVLEMKTNISLEFVNLVSALHYRNGNPLDMARKKMRYFLYAVRIKYGIHAQPFREEHIVLLADKSKVAVDEVRTIFAQYGSIESNAYYNTQQDKLLSLYNAIENFNKKCK